MVAALCLSSLNVPLSSIAIVHQAGGISMKFSKLFNMKQLGSCAYFQPSQAYKSQPSHSINSGILKENLLHDVQSINFKSTHVPYVGRIPHHLLLVGVPPQHSSQFL